MKNSKLYYQILLVVTLGLFTDGYFLYMASCTEPLIKLALQLSNCQVGIMQAIAPVGAVLGALLSGPLTDKHGRKPMLAFDLTLFLLVSILLFFAHSYSEIIIERFMIGCGVGVGYPIYAAYLTESTANKEHGQIVAISMFVNVLAMPIVALVGYFLYARFATDAWRYIFLSAIIPTILCFISRNKLPESAAWQNLNKTQISEGFFKKYAHLFTVQYRMQTIVLASCWFIMDISYYGIGLFTTDIIHMFKHPNSTEYNFLNDLWDSAIINSFAAWGALLGILAIKYISKKQLQKYGFYLSGLGLCLLALHGSIISSGFFLIALFSLYNIAINIGPDITTYLLPSEAYPPEIKATGHAFSTSIAKTGAVVGSMGLPLLQSLVGVHVLLIFLGISLFVGGYITNFIKEGN